MPKTKAGTTKGDDTKRMRKLSVIVLTLSLSLLLGATARAEGDWLTSWDEAAKQSKKSGKPILIDFTGSDWCGWCIKLKKEVFDTRNSRPGPRRTWSCWRSTFPRANPRAPS